MAFPFTHYRSLKADTKYRRTFNQSRSVLTLCMTVTLSTSVFANAQTPSARQEPSTVTSDARVSYRSVFDRYQRFREQDAGGWRDANDTVSRIGGWRAYLKEAQQPAPIESPSRADSPASQSSPLPAPNTTREPAPSQHRHGGKQ